jgi:aldehyde dehydrogenase (NAD(P)+)
LVEWLTTCLSSSEDEIVTIQGASSTNVDQAVIAARRAFEGVWSEIAASERGAFLYKIAELIKRDRELIASIDALDNGKVFQTSSHIN